VHRSTKYCSTFFSPGVIIIINLLPEIISLTKQASEEILKFYHSDTTSLDVQHKDDNTPLTAADLAAHNTILNGLTRLTPNIPVLSEEDANTPYDQRKNWGKYWLVDPLDGTREFIKRNGEFTVNIALIEDQKPILGVIYTPVTNVCYYAAKGSGAFKLEPNSDPCAISVRKTSLKKVHVGGSRSHLDSSLNNFLHNIANYELTKMGSSLKSCLVAEGKLDIYPRLGPTSEWDTAAAQCIVEEAGGFITTTDMKPLRYNTKESLLNPHFLVFGDDSIHWPSYI